MRGCDAGPADMLAAMPAFWVGLLYDATSLDAAWQLVKGWSAEERQALRDAVPREGLAATLGGRKLGEIAGEVLELSRAGLARRAHRNVAGRDEGIYLDPLSEIVQREQTLSQNLVARYRGEWGGAVEPVLTELAL
jgi:glutamate--cysteine ligase